MRRGNCKWLKNDAAVSGRAVIVTATDDNCAVRGTSGNGHVGDTGLLLKKKGENS